MTIDEEIFKNCKNLKTIISGYLDTSNINSEIAKKYNVGIFSLKYENNYKKSARREYVFAGLFYLLRSISYAHDDIKVGKLDFRNLDSQEIAGKTIGIVCTTSIGTDHIDLQYCKKRGIKVINFHDYHATSVAEMGFSQLLTLLRKTHISHQHIKAGGWDYSLFEGNELKGKNLGLIGAGNIGKEIIKIAKGFEMNIFCNTKRPSKKRSKELNIENFYSLNEVLKNSDFVFLAVPATNETINLINKNTLKLMKKTSFLINIARPQILNTLDLAEAIYNKTISGVALDIIEKEPFDVRKTSILIQEIVNSNNVLISPHIAMMTREAIER